MTRNPAGRGLAVVCLISRLLTAVLVLGIVPGCELFNGMPVAVIAFTPAEEYPIDPEACIISVTFSVPMNRIISEEAFSFASGGVDAAGRFSWEGTAMTFYPDTDLVLSGEYEIRVSGGAEDLYGNDLGEPFHHRFAFTGDRTRPFIVSLSPEQGEQVAGDHTPVVMRFSEIVDKRSLYEAFSLAPHTSGNFRWSEEDSVCSFIPASAYASATEYTLVIGASLSDVAGNSMGEDVCRSFYIGAEHENPQVMSVGNQAGTMILTPDDPADESMTINEGWERFWNIAVQMSEPVQVRDLESYVALVPDILFSIDAGKDITSPRFTLNFDEPLIFDCLLTLRIKKGLPDEWGNVLAEDRVYFFKTNGSASFPPSVSRVTFLENPAEPFPVLSALSPFGNIDLANYEPHPPGFVMGFFDFYLVLAAGADPEILSFMENFFITAENGCALFEPRALEWGTYSGPPPEPFPGETAVRAWTSIEDDAAAGIITLKLKAGFRDTLNNNLSEDWVIILNEATGP